jgi:alkylation response protein AidB-like acyl-CoA dehydrogenase
MSIAQAAARGKSGAALCVMADDEPIERARVHWAPASPGLRHHQGNAFELAVVATELHGARLMVREAAAAFDAGDALAGFWATQAWLGALAAATQITDLGVQLLGGHGFLIDHLAEKRFREARMLALLHGGRDAAEADLSAMVLDVPHPVFGLQEAP